MPAVSVTQLCMLLCEIREESVFKRETVENQCVLCACAREWNREKRGKRFKDREDKMLDMR